MTLLLLIIFASAAVVAYASTHPVKQLAERIGCIDRPNQRSFHSVATPRLGGISIILGFATPLLLLPIAIPSELVTKNLTYLLAVLASGSCIIALGIYDDIFGADASKKFPIQGIAAAILIGFGFHFDFITLPFIGRIDFGILAYLVTFIWIVGVINAVNFLDGMDGLATLVATVICVVLGIIAAIIGDMFSLVIVTALAGSLTGFFPWNRRPAKIFMGDTGSLFIGLLLAACSIARNSKSPTALAIAGPVLALALPVLDTLIVMKGRFEESQPSIALRFLRMFNADRSHFHHILVEKYGSQRKAVVWMLIVTIVFGVAAIATVFPSARTIGYGLGAVGTLLMIFLRLRKDSTAAFADVRSDEEQRAAI